MATDNAVEVLNDLIQINNDRSDGFQRAIKELGDGDQDLKSLFETYSQQSRRYAEELSSLVAQHGGSPDTGNTISGTLHRAWLDVRGTFSGHDRKNILDECERGEDAAKKAYTDAMSHSSEMAPGASEILTRQYQEVQAAHDRVRALRNTANNLP